MRNENQHFPLFPKSFLTFQIQLRFNPHLICHIQLGVEHLAIKGENAGCQHFLYFPIIFSKAFFVGGGDATSPGSSGGFMVPTLQILSRIDDSHYNSIYSCLTGDHCFKDYEGKKPIVWKEYDDEYSHKKLQKSMDRCIVCQNPLPDDKILDWSKLKQIADDILK